MLRPFSTKYADYILPNEESVKRLADSILVKTSHKDKLGVASLVCEWIFQNIKHIGKMFNPKDLHPSVVLRKRRGSCLALSMLMVSILRSLGFNEDDVFLVVALHRGEHPFQATHSFVIINLSDKEASKLNDESTIAIFDPSKNYFELTKLGALLLTNVVVLVFNDKISLIPEFTQAIS